MKAPRLWLWLPLLLIAAALIWWSDGPYDVDDAPITYRYAEQLAGGHGFTYNDGEAILGTSTPLYTLLLAGLRLTGVTIPQVSNIINFVSSLAIVWVTMTLTAEVSGSVVAGALAALYLMLQGAFLRFTMSGMETPLYTLLIMGTFLLAVRRRTQWAAVLAGLAFVMRLDGLAVGGALLLGLWLQRKKLPFSEGVLYLAVLLPWVLFAFWYFGSPIPLSMTAKQHHLAVSGGDRYWIWRHLFISALGAPRILLPLALPGLLICYRQNRQNRYWLIPLLWLLAYLVAYTIVGIDFYEWYLMPVYPILALLIGIGLWLVLKAIQEQLAPLKLPLVAPAATLLVLALWLWPYQQHMVDSVRGYKEYLQVVEGSRVQVGQWLLAHAPPTSKVMTGAIGHVGYQSDLYIIDSAGLITPAALMEQLHPDYYVLGGAPSERACGALKDFDTQRFATPLGYALISGCDLPALGAFGGFTLAHSRITNWVRSAQGQWQAAPGLYLETQWLIDAPQPDRWTLYVHFTDSVGKTMFQADHELGLQIDRSVLAPSAWDATERIYGYAAMPAEWSTQKENVAAIRVGLWNPETGERLPAHPGYHPVDESGRLVIPVQEGEIPPPVKS
ncbi:MAG: hypothetical protein DYG89_22435 [Caldilinea sp. CFX5]|nr:hypothetical protein [Caldilinea sp. CFX5]